MYLPRNTDGTVVHVNRFPERTLPEQASERIYDLAERVQRTSPTSVVGKKVRAEMASLQELTMLSGNNAV